MLERRKESPLYSITDEQLIAILEDLGSTYYKRENNALIFSSICCDSPHKNKLYAYRNEDGRISFHCYYCAEQFDIISLLQHLGVASEFKECMQYLSSYLPITFTRELQVGFGEIEKISDFSLFSLYNRPKKITPKFEIYDDKVLALFSKHLFYDGWIKDNISIDTMKKFGIRYDIVNNAIIIPNRNLKGELIGIRQRNLDEELVLAKMKYVPTTIGQNTYKFSSGFHLYGIYENQEAIRRTKRAILFEAEKSVLQVNSYYGNNSYALAMLGSSFSKFQRDLLIDLGAENIVICYDRDFENVDTKEYRLFVKKVQRIRDMMKPYANVYVVDDSTTNLLGINDSPSDRGKEVFETLLDSKIYL